MAAAVAWTLGLSLATHRSGGAAILGRYSLPFFAVLLAIVGLALCLTLAQWGPLFRALSRRRIEIGLVVVTVLASLLLFEGFLRIFDPVGISWYQESSRYQRQRVPDPELVYRHPANLEARFQGVSVSFNELGLRDRPIGPKAPDEFRVLILGDSITFGWGVEVEDTFARKLETELQTVLGGHVRTINAGVGSYNTDQELAFLLRHGATLDPDVVLLVYYSNDVNRSRSPEAAMAARSFSGKKPHEQLNLLLAKLWTYRLAFHLAGLWTTPTAPNPDAPGWRSSMQSLARMAEHCRELGVSFGTVFWRVSGGPVTDALDTSLAAVASREGFPYADALPWFDGREPQDVINSTVDMHPNVEGNAISARGMARFLREAGLLEKRTGGTAATTR